MDLNIATCRPLPEPDVDEDLLLAALRAAGVNARMAAWRDVLSWSDPTPTVIRSTWDYIHYPDEFMRWVRRVGSHAPLWNSPQAVLGNLHKRYLLELAARGVPVTPTVVLERGAVIDLPALGTSRGWHDIVLKPAVGAGSHETHRGDPQTTEMGRLAARLLQQGDVLVQPYLPAVEGHGERALVWIDGEFTHAVRKSPRFAGGSESVSEALPIAAAERAVGEAALHAMRTADLLYARVDVAPGVDGEPVVMELELVEPSLFLLQYPPALERLVAGIVRRLRA
jgi:glutathione synthase/RimK-type ligase-like ATP-grasp enzyme